MSSTFSTSTSACSTAMTREFCWELWRSATHLSRVSCVPFVGCGLTEGRVQELATAVALDMPAEALLQRQSLMENVVLLLKPAALDSPLPAAALRLLHVVVARLKAAVELAHNPGLQLPRGAQSEDSLAPVLCSWPAGLLAHLPCLPMHAAA